jgi:hypothetical protein
LLMWKITSLSKLTIAFLEEIFTLFSFIVPWNVIFLLQLVISMCEWTLLIWASSSLLVCPTQLGLYFLLIILLKWYLIFKWLKASLRSLHLTGIVVFIREYLFTSLLLLLFILLKRFKFEAFCWQLLWRWRLLTLLPNLRRIIYIFFFLTHLSTSLLINGIEWCLISIYTLLI